MTRSTWVSLIAASAVALASAYCANQPAAPEPKADRLAPESRGMSSGIDARRISMLKEALSEEVRWGVFLTETMASPRCRDFDWRPLISRVSKSLSAPLFHLSLIAHIEQRGDLAHPDAQAVSRIERAERELPEIKKERKKISRDVLRQVFGVDSEEYLNALDQQSDKLFYDVGAGPGATQEKP